MALGMGRIRSARNVPPRRFRRGRLHLFLRLLRDPIIPTLSGLIAILNSVSFVCRRDKYEGMEYLFVIGVSSGS